jgi:hypothetical protein
MAAKAKPLIPHSSKKKEHLSFLGAALLAK